MGRQGRIWNCVRIFSAAGFAAAMRRRCTCRGRSKPQRVENSGVLEFSFPLCKSGPAFDRMRSCALRFAAAAGLTRGLWRSGCEARAAERRCAGPVAARVRIAAPPVLPDGGRPVGTAWKGFESDVSLLLFPPALRRCEASLRSPRKLPKHVESGGVSNLPSRSGRAGQHSIECVPARCVLQRRPGRRRGYGGAGAARCAGAAWMLVAAPPCCAGGRPVGTAWKDSKLRRFSICRPLRGGDAAPLCWPQFLFVLRMPARVRLRLSV